MDVDEPYTPQFQEFADALDGDREMERTSLADSVRRSRWCSRPTGRRPRPDRRDERDIAVSAVPQARVGGHRLRWPGVQAILASVAVFDPADRPLEMPSKAHR